MRFRRYSVFPFAFIVGVLSSCGGGSGGSSTPTVSPSVSSQTSSSSTSSVANSPLTCEVLNFKNEETISYRLPIIYGHCSPNTKNSVDIEVAGKTYTWPLSEGYFKGAVLLNQGDNDIRFATNDKTVLKKLRYEPSDNTYKVQVVYATAANDDGHYLAAAGEPNAIASAKQRLVLQGLMMQSANAEMMYKGTGKHTTYTLVEDADGMPAVSVFEMKEERETLYSMDGESIYYSLQNQLKTEAQVLIKYMVNMGFSDYKNGKNLAHTALGGQHLALFGSLHLHTCPATLDDIATSFSNTTQINTAILPDDSNGRGTYWANCATGMGASLHELGHTLGLPHTDYGIMMRGFDRFNRLFMINEPGFSKTVTTEQEYDAIWHEDSLSILLYSPWIPH